MQKNDLEALIQQKHTELTALEAAIIKSEAYQAMMQKQGEVKVLYEIQSRFYPADSGDPAPPTNQP